ncbi:MAG TPA: GntR family transcriptional regulator [Streptosporangiaceae bacterium]|nr:GntR family transcriptional regulator [Streptosporangiaceae bacterium]
MADPMYRRIADDLKRQIESGELSPGEQIRTEIELREHYEASRNTVRDAIKWLITRGLVETRPGQGTYVVETLTPLVTTLTGDPESASGGEGHTYTEEVTAHFRKPADSAPRVELHDTSGADVSELQLEAGSTVVSRHQQRYIDGTPWSLQTSFYPMSFVNDGAGKLLQAGNIEEGTVAYLRAALGIKQQGFRDVVIVRAPDEIETTFFRLPADGRVSVIEIRRTAFGDAGSPVRLTVSVYPADRNRFAVAVGRVPKEVTSPPSVHADDNVEGTDDTTSGGSG